MKQKQTKKLNETQLRKMINETIKNILKEDRDIDDDNYSGGGLPDSYYQYPGLEQPDVYDDDEPSMPEDVGDFIYERVKSLPIKVDRYDAKNLNSLDIRLSNVYHDLRNHVGEKDAIKYIKEYVKYYLPDYKYAYHQIRHVLENAKWLFNENF